jgi:hypothetical protein
MKKLFITILISSCLFSYAQTAKKISPIRFRSTNQVGLTQGQKGATFLLQSINGIQYQTYLVGIGVGLDYYKQRSVPLFLELRKHLFKRNNTPYVYADGGYHFIWSDEDSPDWIVTEEKGGLHCDLGMGYRFPVFESRALTISLGYSIKNMSEVINLHPERSSWPPPASDFQKFEYNLRRYSFKMGLTL